MMNNNQQQFYYNQHQTPNNYSSGSTYGGSSFAFAHAPPPSVNPSYHAPPPPPPAHVPYYPTQQQQPQQPAARPSVPPPAPVVAPTASFAQGDLIDFSANPSAFTTQPQPQPSHNVPQQIVVVHDGGSGGGTAAGLSTEQQRHPSWTPDLVDSQTEIQTQIHQDVVDEQLKIMADICRRNIQEQDDRELARRLSNHASTNTGRGALVEYNRPPHATTNSGHNNNNGRIVPHSTATGTIDNPTPIAPKRQKLKQVRPYKTAVGAAGGAVVGGLVLAPVAPLGVVLGAAAGGAATNKICKANERRVQRKYEQHNFQLQAELSSPLAKQNGHADLV